MKKLFISALCLATFWSCANSEDTPPQAEAGNVYMQFSLKMETTRSATDENAGETNSNANPDYEVGFDRENKVSSVDIELHNVADPTNVVVADNVIPTTAATDTYVASFTSMNLKPNATYNVYIYANGQSQQNVDAIYNVTDADVTKSIAADNSFLMTNAYEAKDYAVILPTDLSLYTQVNTPLNLGSHYVERAAARFDYKTVKTDNKYTVGKDSAGATTVQVQLTHAALVNMSKAFYYLRRVSADGTATDAVVGGVETPANYVVDTDYAAKNAVNKNTAATLSASNFYYSMTNPTAWSWDSLAGLTNADNYTDTPYGAYNIWRYAVENTIPGDVSHQVNGISTGVVFKGNLVATDNAPESLKTALASKKKVYVYNNVLYGTWADVKTAAEAKKDDVLVNPELTAAYNQAIVGMTENATDPVVATAAAAGFTGYAYSEDANGYEVLYYYWNRHNDNGDNAIMGKMEFAVVRNNVYKLAVDNISRFGHPYNPDPNNPENPDPDPVDPTDPDEELNYYFNVTVKVLPWVVRVNHIEF